MESAVSAESRRFKNILSGVTGEMETCIRNCVQCHQTCEQMIQHCLSMGGPHAAPEHIRILQDCTQACAVSADFMLRDSNLHKRTCAVCAEACRVCADDCDRFADDEMMKMCADVCRRCADSCEKMASMQ